jgi:hypothetical protein
VVPTGTRCTILDLTAVAPGTYALRVMDGTGWHVERLIKD